MKKMILSTLVFLGVFTLAACSDNTDIETFEILNRRDDNARLAYVHDDHWDGELPNIAVGQSLSLGAHIAHGDGESIILDRDGQNSLTVTLAEDAPEGIVEFALYGDHVHIIGASTGLTQVVFHWETSTGVEYSTPAINVLVVEAHEHDDHDDHDHDMDVNTFEILNRRDGHTKTAYVHGDHWHGSLPNVVLGGQSSSLGANIIDSEGNDVTLDREGHNSFVVALAEGAPEGIVEFGQHGDHVHIIGVSAGLTQVVFQWVHDGEVKYTTPAINVLVVEDDHHNHDHDMEVNTFEILNRRDGHTKTAYVHGDHWHGSLPNVVLGGQSSSLGANITDSEGNEINLSSDGHNQFVVALADGASEGIVEFGQHGDHVHIIGVSAGLTQVVFQWVHDGEVRFTTPPINVLVVEDDHDDNSY